MVNPFADDVGREIALLDRKLAAGAEFVQSQMTFDVTALTTFLDRAAGLLHDVRFYAGLGLLRNERMADRARGLPGCVLPDAAHRRIVLGDGLRLAKELARELAGIAAVDALHIYPLGAESATRDIAAAFRTARGAPAYRH